MAPRMVIKKDGSRETFSREKILRGLAKACDKRNIPMYVLEDLVDRVEAKIYDRYEREAPAQAIGELVSEELKKVDQVAYVRFASVYKQFEDVTGFVEILRSLLKRDILEKEENGASDTRSTKTGQAHSSVRSE